MINISGILFFKKHRKQITEFQKKIHTNPLSVQQIIKLKDKKYSRFIFSLDEPFLFVESYFWILSLFFITNNNFLKLGFLSIILALFFSLTFWFIKNKIDHINPQKTYIVATLGYAISWFFRSLIDTTIPLIFLSVFILSITFFTSFFRLTFNKRFFDIAHEGNGINYLFLKSYNSQLSVFIFFGLLSFSLYSNLQIELNSIYFYLGFIALFFIRYQRKES